MPRSSIDAGVVLLTGASSGIGREIALIVGRRAAKIALVARRRERLEKLAEELTAARPELVVHVAPCDLNDPVQTAELVGKVAAELGPVDVLINNAGLGDLTLFERSDAAKNAMMINVNILALQQLTRDVLPGMVERGRGGILNISSGFGLTWLPGGAAYIGSKHFVTAFTESLRCEVAGTGVVVTQICPGPVATEFEAVAGNPTGVSVPSFVELSAERCARESIAAFDARKAMHLPGFLIRWLTRFGIWTPRVILRLVYNVMGKMLRRKVQQAG